METNSEKTRWLCTLSSLLPFKHISTSTLKYGYSWSSAIYLQLYFWGEWHCSMPFWIHKIFVWSQEALLQLVFASLVATCGLVNGQSADYDPLYIGNLSIVQLAVLPIRPATTPINSQFSKKLTNDQRSFLFSGKFEDLAHSVGGDIFVLDDKTIYIQVRNMHFL